MLNLSLAVAMVTSCTFEEMTLFLQSGCKTNSLWTFLIISETHHVPPDFEIYVEWYLKTRVGMRVIILDPNWKLFILAIKNIRKYIRDAK